MSVAELTFRVADPVTPLKVAEMLAVPAATPVAVPPGPTVATAGLSEVQFESRLITWVLESLNVPVATNESCVPGAIVRFTGVIDMDTIVAFVTSSVADALTDPSAAVMVVIPGLRPFAIPLLAPTLATSGFDELHEHWTVRSWVLPSLKVPIAENDSRVPWAMVALLGMTASDARLAAFTVAWVLPLTEPEVAVMVTDPRLRAVAKPPVVIDATRLFEEVHVTVPVMSCVVPSEKFPVAVNCCRVPRGMEGLAGDTTIESKLALVTVRVALEAMLPELAVMIEVPGVNPFASPATPLTSILATAGFDELQLTVDVMFCVLPSVNVPVAVNWVVVDAAMETLEGETAMDTRAGAVTVREVLPLTPEDAAVIMVDPMAALVAKPLLDIVAALEFEELQLAVFVRSWLLPSVKVPIAMNWREVPSAIDGVAGDIAIKTRAAAVTVKVVLPLTAE